MIFLYILTFFLGSVCAAADYHERLVLRPLPRGSLLASFDFRSNASASSIEKQNYQYFPRSLGQILQHAHTRELHLRFSLGRWDAETWGSRPWNGRKEGGTGVELWAWVEAENDEEAAARWTTLTNALSGLFCASLNFIDSTRTIRPAISFEPSGHHSEATLSKLHLLHGTLPREPVCTENLTPFLKLLPCKGKAGISSLLDGHKLFDASWQSMSIDVRPVCSSDSNCVLEMGQTVDMVLDIERSKRHRDNPIPRPVAPEELACDTSKPYASSDACYPLDSTSEQPWSLSEIFGRPMKHSCPLTDSEGEGAETVCIEVPHERQVYATAGSTEHKRPDGFSRCYKLSEISDFDISLPQQTLSTSHPLSKPPLYAERSFTGYGQERGGVQTLLTNPSQTDSIEFIYLESLPWFMKPYLHTLKASLINGLRGSSSSDNVDTSSTSIIQEIFYRPALDRRRGTQLEVRLIVPPASTAALTYDFDKAILRYTEYPPDANRGFDVAPAVVRVLSSSSSFTSDSIFEKDQSESELPVQDSIYLRTTSLLLPLPTPDFSMPYNVIILTSTVMALAFGSIFNLLVRRFVGADEVEGLNVSGIKGKVLARIRKVKERFDNVKKIRTNATSHTNGVEKEKGNEGKKNQ
ncbi:GPI transamidase component Gpi16 [Xylona heveae TC161]|uniref:GPI transamidase component Gpi16 n=1 Tax=Xylona heveae (strain CBS 132557 / TC161) TaxID=1328760 RepID=A0A165FJV8_XYLHT|nr:GPI transamidase component Gpi16 [Xylona heveae TC161]KZF21062.1 GPI transamidase component Gpi16 [Xylona heveae TC161]